MKSFNQELKSAIVAEIRKHREQDQVVQGEYATYGKDFSRPPKYCAIGCTIQATATVLGTRVYSWSNHKKYVDWLGIPEILAELQDVIHEVLSDESFPTWQERFMEAVPTETDLSLVFPKFAWWLVVDGMLEHAQKRTMWDIGNAAGLMATAGIWKTPVPKEEWITKSYYLLKCYSEDKVAIVVGQLLRACSPVGIRQDIDKALRGAATVLGGYFGCNEQFYEKCAEKLIELLKAEGNDQQ